MKSGQQQQASNKRDVVKEVVDTAKSQTQVNSSTVWIIGDKERGRSRQFKNTGWTIGCTKHGTLNDNRRNNYRKRLQSEKPLLLYIVNFGGMGHTEENSTFLLDLINDQLNLRGLILIEAPEDSSAWNMPHGKLTEGTDWIRSK